MIGRDGVADSPGGLGQGGSGKGFGVRDLLGSGVLGLVGGGEVQGGCKGTFERRGFGSEHVEHTRACSRSSLLLPRAGVSADTIPFM